MTDVDAVENFYAVQRILFFAGRNLRVAGTLVDKAVSSPGGCNGRNTPLSASPSIRNERNNNGTEETLIAI